MSGTLQNILARNPAKFAANSQPVQIVDVGTGEPTGLVIYVFSKDHPNFKAEAAAFARRNAERVSRLPAHKRGEPLSQEEMLSMGARLTASVIDRVEINGEPSADFPQDLQGRADLLAANEWLIEQLDARITDRAAFMQPPAKN